MTEKWLDNNNFIISLENDGKYYIQYGNNKYSSDEEKYVQLLDLFQEQYGDDKYSIKGRYGESSKILLNPKSFEESALDKCIKKVNKKYEINVNKPKEIFPDIWKKISCEVPLCKDFTIKFIDFLSLNSLCKFQKLSIDVIKKKKGQLNWKIISKYQNLSVKILETYSDYIYWSLASKYQKLKEETIIKFSEFVNWNIISKYQELSESFIVKFQDKLNLEKILEFQNISLTMRRKIYDKIKKGEKIIPQIISSNNNRFKNIEL